MAPVVDGAATVCFNLVVTDFCVDGAVVTALVLNGEDTPVAVAPTASGCAVSVPGRVDFGRIDRAQILVDAPGPVRLRWRQHNILDVIHPECGQQGLRWPS